MQQKPAITSVNIHDLIANRWSPRAFDPNKAIAHTDLLALLEAARWASSCFNEQPWRLVICDKNTDLPSWEAALETLVERNRLWAKNAPVLILAVAMENFTHNGTPNRWAQYDTGAASANLSAQAVALGLAVHQMGGFNAGQARAVFGLPDACTPIAMMAVGYQADIGTLDEVFVVAEQAERVRADLAERFYAGKWGVGIG